MPIRVVLAEDNYLLREGIRQLLETSDEIQLIESCVDLPGLERAIEEHSPAVVITDIRMPPTGTDEGLRAAERLRAERPEVGVVVLSQYAEPEYALALLEKGASGRAYLLKERVSDIDQLVGAVREVARGGSVIDPRVVEVLVAARSAVRELADRSIDASRARCAPAGCDGKEQRRHRCSALPYRARGREAHQRNLLEAGALRGA